MDHCAAHHLCWLDRDGGRPWQSTLLLEWQFSWLYYCSSHCHSLIFWRYFHLTTLFIAACFSSSLVVQHGSSSAYRVGQAVGLRRGLWWGGSLGAPEQWYPAGRGEEEQQEATFLYFSDYVPQTYASPPPSAPLHGNQRASPHKLE